MDLKGYDEWKTSPPEHDDKFVCQCETCNEDLYAGDEAWYFQPDDLYFCSQECFKKYLLRDPEALADDMIEMLEEAGDLYESEVEAD